MASSTSFKNVKVTILASEWGSHYERLSIMNRELAIQLAAFSGVEVTVFLIKCSPKDKNEAERYGITILQAVRRPGVVDELEWLSYPPDNLQIDVVVGHGVKLGHQAQFIRKSHKCKWVQFVHTDPEERGILKSEFLRTDPEERGIFKCDRNSILIGEEEHKTEIELCKMADFVVGVGSKLAGQFRSSLRCCDKDVFEFTPGVFVDFGTFQLSPYVRIPPTVLLFGQGDVEDFELEGFDIAAKSIAVLPDIRLLFVEAPHGKHEEIAKRFVDCGIPRNRLTVRGYLDLESLEQVFCEVDLVLMPSRTKEFGFTGLVALSAGLPVIVSKNSGFGEALSRIRFGSSWVIDSEDPTVWTAAIKGIRNKEIMLRLEEVKAMQDLYSKRYAWSKQCKDLLKQMFKLVNGPSSEFDGRRWPLQNRCRKRKKGFRMYVGLSPVSESIRRVLRKRRQKQEILLAEAFHRCEQKAEQTLPQGRPFSVAKGRRRALRKRHQGQEKILRGCPSVFESIRQARLRRKRQKNKMILQGLLEGDYQDICLRGAGLLEGDYQDICLRGAETSSKDESTRKVLPMMNRDQNEGFQGTHSELWRIMEALQRMHLELEKDLLQTSSEDEYRIKVLQELNRLQNRVFQGCFFEPWTFIHALQRMHLEVEEGLRENSSKDEYRIKVLQVLNRLQNGVFKETSSKDESTRKVLPMMNRDQNKGLDGTSSEVESTRKVLPMMNRDQNKGLDETSSKDESTRKVLPMMNRDQNKGLDGTSSEVESTRKVLPMMNRDQNKGLDETSSKDESTRKVLPMMNRDQNEGFQGSFSEVRRIMGALERMHLEVEGDLRETSSKDEYRIKVLQELNRLQNGVFQGSFSEVGRIMRALQRMHLEVEEYLRETSSEDEYRIKVLQELNRLQNRVFQGSLVELRMLMQALQRMHLEVEEDLGDFLYYCDHDPTIQLLQVLNRLQNMVFRGSFSEVRRIMGTLQRMHLEVEGDLRETYCDDERTIKVLQVLNRLQNMVFRGSLFELRTLMQALQRMHLEVEEGLRETSSEDKCRIKMLQELNRLQNIVSQGSLFELRTLMQALQRMHLEVEEDLGEIYCIPKRTIKVLQVLNRLQNMVFRGSLFELRTLMQALQRMHLEVEEDLGEISSEDECRIKVLQVLNRLQNMVSQGFCF
ncbi:myosin-10-like isoform X3 [Acropora muricata]|uniref:myosin-10-like isoform X3 n=1 Tax=Acropora muricata TaxID=159855 RepID=UPI0034E51AEA